MTSRFRWLSLTFWGVFALILVVVFNYNSSLPTVMGISGADVVAGALTVAVWIGTGVYIAIKRKSPP